MGRNDDDAVRAKQIRRQEEEERLKFIASVAEADLHRLNPDE
ncbi:hypothetical protein [Streptomyces sp. NPDC059176]